VDALLLRAHGTLEDVVYGDTPAPTPGPGEVLVEVKAAALNGLDLWVVEGWPGLHLEFPHVMGSDGAGIVVEVGEGVDNYSAGDRVAVNPSLWCGHCRECLSGHENRCDTFSVIGEHVPGFFARYVTLPERNLVLIPDGFPFEAAAAASLVFVTAWHSLIVAGGLRAGEDVLIVGAGGGVNTAAIQIARFAGARTIYVVGSDDEKLALAASLGADVLINRHETNWSREVYLKSAKKGVDVAVDNVGAATYHDSLRSLCKGGRLLTVGNSSGPEFPFDNRYMFGKHLTIIGSTMGTQRDFERVMGLVFNRRLQAVIDDVMPMSRGVHALQRLEEGDVAGKLVLVPSGED
jgi:NADPH:quinone reductase-like Zn-dependent oxidoreductase